MHKPAFWGLGVSTGTKLAALAVTTRFLNLSLARAAPGVEAPPAVDGGLPEPDEQLLVAIYHAWLEHFHRVQTSTASGK